jgi:hypothetical protein
VRAVARQGLSAPHRPRLLSRPTNDSGACQFSGTTLWTMGRQIEGSWLLGPLGGRTEVRSCQSRVQPQCEVDTSGRPRGPGHDRRHRRSRGHPRVGCRGSRVSGGPVHAVPGRLGGALRQLPPTQVARRSIGTCFAAVSGSPRSDIPARAGAVSSRRRPGSELRV